MPSDKRLKLRFHGRVIDHLGIDMYQSPVAAVAELVSNAWDADAEKVVITLPRTVGPAGILEIADDGHGMTLEDCEKRFLAVGYDRRKGDAKARSSGKQRPLMGRKGIGKFAGFGIADVVEIETISAETGERTKFSLDIRHLRGDGGDYVGTDESDIEVADYEGPDEARKSAHGTTVRLRKLTMAKRPSATQFIRSMARRFLLLERTGDFRLFVGSDPIRSVDDSEQIEFDFPRDFRPDEVPDSLRMEELPPPEDVLGKGSAAPPAPTGWGIERLDSGRLIRWRVLFYKEPITEEDLAGISVFAHGKLAQAPFLFNLTGGLGGQHGAVYMSGQVEADFIDEQSRDLIATERQRVNWEAAETQELLKWGQRRVRRLLALWRDRRGEEKVKALEERIAPFSARLAKLPTREREVVKRALRNIAKIETLSQRQFADLAASVLTAWEGGRLLDLTHQLADADSLDEADLLNIMVEARVLTALHTAEAVKAQLNLVLGLRDRIASRELENAVRDFIAENPWLVSPEWSTFQKERSVEHVTDAAAVEAGLPADAAFRGRIDLVLSSGDHLLLLEFMRPGVKVDWDHISRFERYVRAIRTRVRSVSGGRFKRVSGILIADRLHDDATFLDKIEAMEAEGMRTLDWGTLLRQAGAQWEDYLDLLVERAPEDDRVAALKPAAGPTVPAHPQPGEVRTDEQE